jgi:hypothetical protein
MAKLKMLKLPKKPKASASLETKQKFLAKAGEIKKENVRRNQINDKSAKLDKVISGVTNSSVIVRPSSFNAKVVRTKRSGASTVATKAKKKTTARKTAAKKKSR